MYFLRPVTTTRPVFIRGLKLSIRLVFLSGPTLSTPLTSDPSLTPNTWSELTPQDTDFYYDKRWAGGGSVSAEPSGERNCCSRLQRFFTEAKKASRKYYWTNQTRGRCSATPDTCVLNGLTGSVVLEQTLTTQAKQKPPSCCFVLTTDLQGYIVDRSEGVEEEREAPEEECSAG